MHMHVSEILVSHLNVDMKLFDTSADTYYSIW